MEYFLMSQDTDFLNIVSIKRQQIPREWLSLNNMERRLYPSADKFIGRNYNILVESNKRNLYLDFLEFPVPLLSTVLKDIFFSYMPQMPCSCVLLSDQKLRKQHTYWIFELEHIECLSDYTVRHPDGTLKNIVVDKAKVEDRTIFRINGGIQKPLIIRGDVAESILRRSLLGVRLEYVRHIG